MAKLISAASSLEIEVTADVRLKLLPFRAEARFSFGQTLRSGGDYGNMKQRPS